MEINTDVFPHQIDEVFTHGNDLYIQGKNVHVHVHYYSRSERGYSYDSDDSESYHNQQQKSYKTFEPVIGIFNLDTSEWQQLPVAKDLYDYDHGKYRFFCLPYDKWGEPHLTVFSSTILAITSHLRWFKTPLNFKFPENKFCFQKRI